MPVPAFQEMFLPCLQFLVDGTPRRITEISEHIIQHFGLTEDERQERTPGGSATRVGNRVGWMRTHLRNAGLIEPMARGVYRITDHGRRIAASPPPVLDLKYLDTIPAHFHWFHTKRAGSEATSVAATSEDQTPEEQVDALVKSLNRTLAGELRDTLTTINPYRFEKVVLDLLSAMGYGGSREEAARVTRRSNDEGIDGVINEDRLGLDVIYVQAKRWQGTVGRKEIQSFVGALAGKQASKGVFITTSDFTDTAVDYARNLQQKVVLIDGVRLAELMIEHDVGVSTATTFSIKRLDSDYFDESA